MRHEEFKDWYVRWFARAGATLVWADAVESTPEAREQDLQRLVDLGIPPVMLKEDYDEELEAGADTGTNVYPGT